MAVPDGPATAAPPDLDPETLRSLYRSMLRIRMLDEKMLILQRQGRIAFFGPSSGQEAAIVGSGFAARPQDWVFPALREGGILLMRGFPLERWFGQLFGNVLDVEKGRQMPMHFSSAAHRFVSLSSVIATQLPQAAGAAYAARLRGDDVVVLGYLGDGATSEHDFHTAMNFAAVWKAPVVFVCQNNHWAISVPFEKQTASRGIAVKAKAYGMTGARVDGNDVLAVARATMDAHARARAGDGPTLLELVTWRRGGHSSSDDPTRYRDESRVPPWLLLDPLDRYRRWLEGQELWDARLEAQARERFTGLMNDALRAAEAAPRPGLLTLFDDVWAAIPPHLGRQMRELIAEDAAGTAAGAFPL